jgi:hypothetical protein
VSYTSSAVDTDPILITSDLDPFAFSKISMALMLHPLDICRGDLL